MAMEIAMAVAVVLLVALVVLAVFPPHRSPHWWRHGTRPLRRLVRPNHYRW